MGLINILQVLLIASILIYITRFALHIFKPKLNSKEEKCGDNICLTNEICCNHKCKNLFNVNDNCGSCQNVCLDGKQCCNGQCIDLINNNDNCGSCKNVCLDGKQCCNGQCIDLLNDNANCGSCQNICKEQNKKCCNGECVFINIPERCGDCNILCEQGFECNFNQQNNQFICKQPSNYEIINPTNNQVLDYIKEYIGNGGYRLTSINIDNNLSIILNIETVPFISNNGTNLTYQVDTNSPGYGYYSFMYSMLFIDNRVFNNTIPSNITKITINKMIFSVIYNSQFSSNVWSVYNLYSINYF